MKKADTQLGNWERDAAVVLACYNHQVVYGTEAREQVPLFNLLRSNNKTSPNNAI